MHRTTIGAASAALLLLMLGMPTASADTVSAIAECQNEDQTEGGSGEFGFDQTVLGVPSGEEPSGDAQGMADGLTYFATYSASTVTVYDGSSEGGRVGAQAHPGCGGTGGVVAVTVLGQNGVQFCMKGGFKVSINTVQAIMETIALTMENGELTIAKGYTHPCPYIGGRQ
ncbi:MAG: hypothetical protein ACPGQL_06990 [Thermoplasmatota archaeon]